VNPLEKFYTDNPKWYEKIGAIHALLERVKISEEQSGSVLHLRRRNRILSIHSSTAIEGNQLTLDQVTDVINGKPVWGPPKDIREVQNAWQAYGEMPGYNPWSVADLLQAHAHLTDALIGESGQFRSGGVAVVGSDGTLLHRGACVADVDVATRTVEETSVNVPVNVSVNVPVNELTAKILTLVRAQPKVTAQKMALTLGVTDKTIKRHLKLLREQGRVQRVGSDKAGHWEIIERPS
jgi:Fic family protein